MVSLAAYQHSLLVFHIGNSADVISFTTFYINLFILYTADFLPVLTKGYFNWLMSQC